MYSWLWAHIRVIPLAATAAPDLAGLLDREAQRLLAEDVLAGFGRGDDRVGMQMVGQADVDGVDQAAAEHLAVVRVDPRAAGALGEATGVVGVDVGDGRHLGGVGTRR